MEKGFAAEERISLRFMCFAESACGAGTPWGVLRKSSLKASPPGFQLALVSCSLSSCGQLKVTPVGRSLEVP